MYLDPRTRRVVLDGVDTRRDYFDVDNVTYQALPLRENSDAGLGINSSVFRALPADEDETSSLVVKVCAFADESRNVKHIARRNRFMREIDAMELSLAKGKDNHVVRIEGKGEVRVIRDKWRKQTHQCFLMEAARTDLSDHLADETDISLQQRLLLCAALVRSVRALHDIGVYHRDIKPGNVLLCEDGWKMGDLGLVAFRGDDAEAESREKIGPPTWMSPEAFNKAYCIHRANNRYIDTRLDDRSDVYQLGKLCWHIIQGDIPNGCLKSKDLVEGGESLFGSMLKPMLRYQRSERPLLSEVEASLAPLIRQHSI
jgi:serine/threonine protein kinase